MKKNIYELKKDIPGVKAGSLFKWSEAFNSYVHVKDGVLNYYTQEEVDESASEYFDIYTK